MEYREFRAGDVGVDDEGKLTGIAVPYSRETVIGDLKRGGWKEEVAPGCFRKALSEGDTVLLADHDMAKPISRMSAGTLRMQDADQDLRVAAVPADTSYYRDLKVNINAGNKRGMSIGFIPVKDDWYDDDGNPSNRMVGTKRVLREAKLPEVSIVTNPAYKGTSVSARDDSAALLEERAGAPKPYGDVKYADPRNGKYPIDTAERAKAAWDYINVQANADKYPLNGVSLSSVKAAIEKACKHFGIKTETKAEDVDAETRNPYDDPFYERDEETSGDESREQEPESSTPDEDDQSALRIRMTADAAIQRSRDLGDL